MAADKTGLEGQVRAEAGLCDRLMSGNFILRGDCRQILGKSLTPERQKGVMWGKVQRVNAAGLRPHRQWLELRHVMGPKGSQAWWSWEVGMGLRGAVEGRVCRVPWLKVGEGTVISI